MDSLYYVIKKRINPINLEQKTMKKIILITLLITGCDRATYDRLTQDTISKLSYVKDKHGICYAVLYSAYPSLTAVPCDKVELK